MGGRNAYVRSEKQRPSLEDRVLSTLRMSSLTARQISERIGRPSTSVVDALNALAAKGAVTVVKDDGPRRWKLNKEPRP